MNTFDANTWIGRWSFSFQPALDARALARHLRSHGIDRALVSPLDAVFAPEPGPANRALLKTTRRLSGLVPVPVLNPLLANWREELTECADDARVRIVRVLPGYHGYRLNSPRMAALAAELIDRGLRLAVTVRLIDERHEFWALRIKPVPSADVRALAQRHPGLSVLASGFTRAEVRSSGARRENLFMDLSFAEWHNTIEHVLTNVASDRLVFASHTPFLITAAAVAKLDSARVAARTRARIASGNLEKFLAPRS